MGAYVLSLMVTVDQEYEIQKLFTVNNWPFIKIVSELSSTEHSTITTDTYTLIGQTDTVECTQVEQQAPSDGSRECMELLPVDLNVTLNVADTGHVTSGNAEKGHVTSGNADTSHVTPDISDRGHVTSGIADSGHVISGIAEVNNGDGQMVADSMETISCSMETDIHDITTGQDMAPNHCRIRNGDNHALDCDKTKASELGMSDRIPQVNTTGANDCNIDTTVNDRTNEFDTGNKTSQVNTTVTETINCYADTTVNDENDSTDAGELDKVSNEANDSVVRTDSDNEETDAEDDADTLLEELPSVRHITEVLKSKYPNSDLSNPASGSWSDSKYPNSSRTDPASERWSDYMSDLNVESDGYVSSLSVYFCKWCHNTFPGVKDLKKHERKGQCMFDCQFCQEKFSFKNFPKYQEHLKQHRKACSHCPSMKFDSSAALRSHKVREHANTFQCETCGRKFGLSRHLREHMKTHESSRNHTCSKCGVSVKYKKSLVRHQLSCNGEQRKRGRRKQLPSNVNYPCPECEKVFTSRRLLQQHMYTHGQSNKPCPKCGQSYKHYSSLSRHMMKCVF